MCQAWPRYALACNRGTTGTLGPPVPGLLSGVFWRLKIGVRRGQRFLFARAPNACLFRDGLLSAVWHFPRFINS